MSQNPTITSQSLQEVIDFVEGIHPPSPHPDNPEHSNTPAMAHPGDTESHSLHADYNDSADLPADSGHVPAQGIDDLHSEDLLLAWDPPATSQHAETDATSAPETIPATTAALQSEEVQHAAATPTVNDQPGTSATNTNGASSTPALHLDVVFDDDDMDPLDDDLDGVTETNYPSPATGVQLTAAFAQGSSAHGTPAFIMTEDVVAMLTAAGIMVNEAESIISNAVADGLLRRGASREEAVRFVDGLHRVDLGALALDDRDCGICRGGFFFPIYHHPGPNQS